MKTLSQIVGGVQRAINLISVVLFGFLFFTYNVSSSYGVNFYEKSPEFKVGGLSDAVKTSAGYYSNFLYWILGISIVLGIILLIIQKSKNKDVDLKDTIMSVVILILTLFSFGIMNGIVN